MGLLAGWLAHRGGANQMRWGLLLGVGFLGGFTTFSAFSLETALMIERKACGQAGVYVLASVVLSVGALCARPDARRGGCSHEGGAHPATWTPARTACGSTAGSSGAGRT